jgi:hypothetical protein
VRADPRDAGEKRGYEEESLHGVTPFGAAAHRNPGPAALIWEFLPWP